MYYLNIKLHSVVCYSPVNVHRIADNNYNARNRTITYNIMQFKSYIYNCEFDVR